MTKFKPFIHADKKKRFWLITGESATPERLAQLDEVGPSEIFSRDRYSDICGPFSQRSEATAELELLIGKGE